MSTKDFIFSDNYIAFLEAMRNALKQYDFLKTISANAKLFQGVSSQLSEITRLSATSNFSGIVKALEPLSRIDYSLSIEACSKGLSAMILQLKEVANTTAYFNMSKFSKEFTQSYIPNTKNISMINCTGVKEAFNAIELLNEERSTDKDSDSVDTDNLSNYEILEINETLSYVFEDRSGVLEKLNEVFIVLKPKIKFAIIYILLPLFIAILGNKIYDCYYEARYDSRVREAPDTSSNTINIVAVHQQFFVLDHSIPYFYEIEYEDPETGEIVRGFVSKRSAYRIEQQIESAEENEIALEEQYENEVD